MHNRKDPRDLSHLASPRCLTGTPALETQTCVSVVRKYQLTPAAIIRCRRDSFESDGVTRNGSRMESMYVYSDNDSFKMTESHETHQSHSTNSDASKAMKPQETDQPHAIDNESHRTFPNSSSPCFSHRANPTRKLSHGLHAALNNRMYNW